MAEFENEIGGLATAFAGVSSRATAESNRRRLEIAEGNITAGRQQLDLEKRVQRRQIARELAKFQGAQAAARASRGGGGGSVGSGGAVDFAAQRASAEQAAIVEANAANKEIALTAANQVTFDDPVLAAIQGGIEGMNLGTQIAQALISEAEVKTRQSSKQIGTGGAGGGGPTIPTFENTITSFMAIPGLNINDFLSGIDFGD